MAATLTYLRRIERRVPRCVACGSGGWVDFAAWDEAAVVPDPFAHARMPPEFPLQGIDVLPVICRHCGHVSLFSKTSLAADIAAA